MENRITVSIPTLLARAAVAKTAAEQYGPWIPLVHGNAVNIGLDIDRLTVADNEHVNGKVLLAANRKTLMLVLEACRAFLLFGRDILKPIFGNQYTPEHEALGFKGGSSIPRSAAELQPMLQKYAAFFTANPDLEDPAHNITAARAQALYDDLLAARAAVNTHKAEVEALLKTRNEARTKLRKRMRGVVNEMKQFVDPLDPRWTAFGFNKPGAKQTPDVPENVTAVVMENNSIAVKFPATPRADYHRVYARVIGDDADLVVVGSPKDLDFTIEGSPANAQVEVAVSAVNSGGESGLSDIIAVMTHELRSQEETTLNGA